MNKIIEAIKSMLTVDLAALVLAIIAFIIVIVLNYIRSKKKR